MGDWRRSFFLPISIDCIKAAGDLNVADGFNLYQRNCLGARMRALRISYGLTCKLMGSDRFSQLLQVYLSNVKIKSNHLHHYGCDLWELLSVDQLSADRFDVEPPLSFYQAVCQLEWAAQELLLMPMGEAVDQIRLQNLSSDQQVSLELSLSPTVLLCKSHWVLDELWSRYQQDLICDERGVNSRGLSLKSLGVPEKNCRQGANVIWLHGFDCYQAKIAVLHLSGLELKLLQCLRLMRCFSLAQFCQCCQSLGLDFSLCLNQFVKRQWLSESISINA